MRRTQTLASLAAVILASLSALSFRGHLLFGLAAVALIAAVGYSLLRGAMTKRRTRQFDAADRAARIRDERERRYGR